MPFDIVELQVFISIIVSFDFFNTVRVAVTVILYDVAPSLVKTAMVYESVATPFQFHTISTVCGRVTYWLFSRLPGRYM